MKLSLNWIKDYVEIPADLELSKLAYDLTMSTVEVEEVIDLAAEFENIVVGVVREIKPHPDADKLVICMTDTGDGEHSEHGSLHQIVCGGINIAEGMKVAVARPGAKVRWHGEGDPVVLKKTKVRGVESYGMICSSSEIGLFNLFPYTHEATIMDISMFEAEPGDSLATALGLNDTILVIDNKSLTNRPDLWGHYGIAREIAAIYNSQFIIHNKNGRPLAAPTVGRASPSPTLAPTHSAPLFPNPYSLFPDSPFNITIEDLDLCPRYIGVRIDGVSIMPAPYEIQSRIWRVGMRPINAIVDITNYVMLATGQPTHAFDADAVSGNIIVRRAKPDEKLLLLSGKELSLINDDLVIADESEAIALAGVMGGGKDSILPNTSSVILEIANFNALSVRRTAMRYDTRTEAATRYEKGIDPERADFALTLAMSMFNEVFANAKVSGYHDNFPKPLKCSEINVSQEWLEKRLGQKMSYDHIRGILERLGFAVSLDNNDNDIMHIIAPTWRSTGDVSLPDDIMEEIARIHGLENFEPTPIVTAFDSAINQPRIDIDRKIREYLAFRCGMSEVFTYPWVSDSYISAVLGKDATHGGDGDNNMLEITSPPSANERYLRTSLILNLCKAVSDNLRYFSEFAIFESAQVFFNRNYEERYDPRESLPEQRKHVAGAIVADREKYAEIYRRVKGILESLPRSVHIEPFKLSRSDGKDKPHWADNVAWQNITLGDSDVGVMGLLSQKTALDCGIKNASVMLFEIDIDALKPLPSRENRFQHIPEYPVTEYDISLLFDTQIKWEDIQKTAAGKPGPDNLLQQVSFIEQYKGKQVSEGKKSVTLRLSIGSLKKTLTSDEIESCVNAVIKRLGKALGAESR